ncbi:MAG: class I SAM-dependent methyltransferase [SAR202 cluster bacterium]|nr:class I SAM-dependent methyltransferase [SAR202 cluster bacterium]
MRANWNRNADRWTATCDDDGDSNRRYQSDPPMLALPGDLRGLDVLDPGCRDRCLCRKLARAGARITGVDLSERFLRRATRREGEERLGIRYVAGSATRMHSLASESFDRAVSNHVLMDIIDYAAVLREGFRVLGPGGSFVAVVSHPCFASGDGWVTSAHGSPRPE